METFREGALLGQSSFLERLIDEMPCGAALHRIVCDDIGTAVDYVTLRVNNAFRTLLDVTDKSVVGVKASEHLSMKELRHWLRVFTPVALEGKTTNYTMYSAKNRQAYYGTAICPEHGLFFVMFVKAEDWNQNVMRFPGLDQPEETRARHHS